MAKRRIDRRHETPRARVNPSGKKVWAARATDRDGKLRNLGTRTFKRDAQELIDRFYDEEYGSGAALHPDTAQSYFDNEWLRRHPRDAETEKAYRARVRRALGIPLAGRPLGDFRMDELRPRECGDVVDHMLRVEGRAAAGVKAIVNTLKAMWSDALLDDVCRGNPWKAVRISSKDPRVRKAPRKTNVWSWEQMHAFAAAAPSRQGEAMIRALSDCGLRLGEMLGAERAGLRLSGCRDEGCVAGDVPHLHVDGKTGPRVAPVAPGLEALLRALPPRLDSRLLFPAPRGGRWDPENFYKEVWHRARDASAGMERAVPHDFRHSWVSEMRALAIDPADVAKAAGHTLQTATAVYTHALQRSFEEMRKGVG